jgi:hypothetical protein
MKLYLVLSQTTIALYDWKVKQEKQVYYKCLWEGKWETKSINKSNSQNAKIA